MFSINDKAFGSGKAYILKNEKTGEYAEIVPECGAILNALVFNNGKEYYNVIDGFADVADFKEKNNTSFKSNILFPYPNRMKGGSYSFQDKPYQLPITFEAENNSIHGLVYDQEFSVKNTCSGEDKSCIDLVYESKGFDGYPFSFILEVSYIFSERGLDISTEIINNGDSDFPFGFGWHHYFKVSEKVDTSILQFPANTLLEVDEKMIPNGSEKPYNEFKTEKQIAETNLDTCFFIGNQGEVTISLTSGSNSLKLQYNSKEFPYLQVYTPPHRETIAIEPMTCAPNAFNNKLGLKHLSSGARSANTFSLYK